MEIIGSGTYGCVYFPGFNCKGKIGKKPSNMVSKITTDKIGVESEYNIGQIIKKNLPNYKKHFLIVEKKCSIHKGSLDNYVKSSCHLVDENTKKYHVLYSPYVEGQDLLYFYSSDLKSYKNINKFYTNFFKYYDILCNSMIHLKNLNIVHFDLSLKNIRVETKTNRPLIIDFGMSIVINNLILSQDSRGNVTNFNPKLLLTYFSINPINSQNIVLKYKLFVILLCNIEMIWKHILQMMHLLIY